MRVHGGLDDDDDDEDDNDLCSSSMLSLFKSWALKKRTRNKELTSLVIARVLMNPALHLLSVEKCTDNVLWSFFSGAMLKLATFAVLMTAEEHFIALSSEMRRLARICVYGLEMRPASHGTIIQFSGRNVKRKGGELLVNESAHFNTKA